jgi:uncharacterized protein YodC (DUF2158 family)
MKESKSKIMAGIDAVSSKVVGNNTVEWIDGEGNKHIRLHHTDIVIIGKNGDFTLNSGGWKTVTTKERINEYMPTGSIIQEKSIWYYSYGENRSPFFDGMLIHGDGRPDRIGKDPTKEYAKIKARVKKFVNMLDTLKEIPIPSPGDCWFCHLIDEKGNAWGDKDISHLEAHIKEKYLHGSLIWNALKESGYPHPEIIIQMKLKDDIKRALRKYLLKRLLNTVKV